MLHRVPESETSSIFIPLGNNTEPSLFSTGFEYNLSSSSAVMQYASIILLVTITAHSGFSDERGEEEEEEEV